MNIHIRYILTPEDMREFHGAYRRHRPQLQNREHKKRRRFLIGVGVMAAAIFFVIETLREPAAVATAPATRPEAHGGMLMIMFINFLPWFVIILLVWFFLFRRPLLFFMRRAFRTNPRLAAPNETSITDDQITIQANHATSILQWPHFIRFFETANLFILYTAPNQAHLIPKRAFASATDLDAFRALAQARIGDQPIGFPVLPIAPIAAPPENPPI